MSGTGKSTLLAALASRGHAVLDTDEPGWIRWSGTEREPVWYLERIAAVLDGHRSGRLFVGGCVANQGALYHRFDAVVLLSAPLEVVLARVADRANPFGSTPADRAAIARDTATVEPVLRAGATHELVTTVPVADVVSALEAIAGG